MSLDQIVVFEPDAKYTYASAPRSAGGLRQQASRCIVASVSSHLVGLMPIAVLPAGQCGAVPLWCGFPEAWSSKAL